MGLAYGEKDMSAFDITDAICYRDHAGNEFCRSHFVKFTGGNPLLANRVFDQCDGQDPRTILDEIRMASEPHLSMPAFIAYEAMRYDYMHQGYTMDAFSFSMMEGAINVSVDNGFIPPIDLEAETNDMICELLDAGLIQELDEPKRYGSEDHIYQLAANERQYLIESYDLALVWKAKAVANGYSQATVESTIAEVREAVDLRADMDVLLQYNMNDISSFVLKKLESGGYGTYLLNKHTNGLYSGVEFNEIDDALSNFNHRILNNMASCVFGSHGAVSYIDDSLIVLAKPQPKSSLSM